MAYRCTGQTGGDESSAVSGDLFKGAAKRGSPDEFTPLNVVKKTWC